MRVCKLRTTEARMRPENVIKKGKACKEKDRNIVVDSDSMLKRCRTHFSELLMPELSDDNVTEELIMNNDVDCHPPEQDEVRTTIARLKNNKAANTVELQAELFKTGGGELIRRMHHLIGKIWLEECMPGDGSLSVL